MQTPFFGWRVVAGAFVLAVFGWGLGFYGPPVYLHAVREARGWSVGLVSAAVTAHYLSGALVVANLPALFARFGLPAVIRAGSVLLAVGLLGWASAAEPWQLFLASLLTGCGWVTMGAAAVNAIIAPWFIRQRPRALSMAYNGASIGGVVFSPLWVLAIETLGFQAAAGLIGLVAVGAMFWLTAHVFAATPAALGQSPDGLAETAAAPGPSGAAALPGGALWRNRQFQTLAAAMALSLFAQVGLLAHLFSLIVLPLGATKAGLVAGFATACAIAGRTAFGWLMPEGADRRLAAMANYAVQMLGVGALTASGLQNEALIIAGVALFGFGIGNATSLPPLIAQIEFTRADAARVVPLIVALAQGAYSFAPALFGLLREAFRAGGPAIESIAVCTLTMSVMAAAACVLAIGRKASPPR